MPAGPRQAGEFCWFNILTPRPAEARAYFADVLGWTFDPIPEAGGHMVKAGGDDVGAIFDVARPGGGPDHAPEVGLMIQVAGADAAAARVRELGGRAAAPFDLGPRARMAVCHDPGGAEFDVLEPRTFAGTVADPARAGVPSWFECFAPDVAAATAFYTTLFGWTAHAMPSGIGPYTVFHRGAAPVAGLCALAVAPAGTPPRWHAYFTVDDADRVAGRTLAAGGRVTMALHDIPGVGRTCGLESPQGVAFRVIRHASEGGVR